MRAAPALLAAAGENAWPSLRLLADGKIERASWPLPAACSASSYWPLLLAAVAAAVEAAAVTAIAAAVAGGVQ